MTAYPLKISLRWSQPDFLDLPWDLPISSWKGACSRLEELPHGLSRHPVVFVNYDGVLYALKELPLDVAKKEYDLLQQIDERHIPSVIAVGHAQVSNDQGFSSILITRYLESSLPYRTLFMRPSLERYRQHLLDAIASLLVQLHLAGVFWGDCSLSNSLFRRDAGALRAYLVDAETAEIHSGSCSPTLRFHDLQIMEENIEYDMLDSHTSSLMSENVINLPLSDIGAYIRLRYQRLWEEITREDFIQPEEHFRIQERIRALNSLGFSVGDVELAAINGATQFRLRIEITDRNFHRDQLFDLTGLDVEEKQAQIMMNEIQELRAFLSQSSQRNTPLDVASFHWLEHTYHPVVRHLTPLVDENTTQAELYCQVLEHKWYLSEKAQRDVGHSSATEDFLHHHEGQSKSRTMTPDEISSGD